MSKTFETKRDVDFQLKAIRLLIKDRDGIEFQDQGPHAAVDYVVHKDNTDIAAVEIKGVRKVKSVHDNHSPVVGLRKLVDLQAFARKMRIPNAILVWAYEDGIKYTTINNLKGKIYYGGRPPRDGSTNDQELMFKDTNTNFKIKEYV
jgi:hypothetical protein|tara:strand:- start:1949 stop:2389 length:441 start_codon:yes stop_codon:yes gene_type:complete